MTLRELIPVLEAAAKYSPDLPVMVDRDGRESIVNLVIIDPPGNMAGNRAAVRLYSLSILANSSTGVVKLSPRTPEEAAQLSAFRPLTDPDPAA